MSSIQYSALDPIIQQYFQQMQGSGEGQDRNCPEFKRTLDELFALTKTEVENLVLKRFGAGKLRSIANDMSEEATAFIKNLTAKQICQDYFTHGAWDLLFDRLDPNVLRELGDPDGEYGGYRDTFWARIFSKTPFPDNIVAFLKSLKPEDMPSIQIFLIVSSEGNQEINAILSDQQIQGMRIDGQIQHWFFAHHFIGKLSQNQIQSLNLKLREIKQSDLDQLETRYEDCTVDQQAILRGSR